MFALVLAFIFRESFDIVGRITFESQYWCTCGCLGKPARCFEVRTANVYPRTNQTFPIWTSLYDSARLVGAASRITSSPSNNCTSTYGLGFTMCANLQISHKPFRALTNPASCLGESILCGIRSVAQTLVPTSLYLQHIRPQIGVLPSPLQPCRPNSSPSRRPRT